MCGRFTLKNSSELIAEVFHLAEVPVMEPRYNIAPTQLVPTVLCMPQASAEQFPPNGDPTLRAALTATLSHRRYHQFRALRWGLIPSWAKDRAIGARMINARAETVSEKPSFRTAFRHRRCLVVADGFYEWQRQEKKKQPFYFRLQDGQPFAFAGLWERWQSPDGETVESCTIITTEANQLMHPIHDRMPVILDTKDYDLWLNPAVQKPEALQQLLRPYCSEAMTTYPVSTQVNNPANNSPEFINSL